MMINKNNKNFIGKYGHKHLFINGNIVIDEKLEKLQSKLDCSRKYQRHYEENVSYWRNEDCDDIIDDLVRCDRVIAWCEKEIEHRKEELIAMIEALSNHSKPRRGYVFS